MYGHPYVVFDGYCSGPTIKDVAHERRTNGMTGSQIIFDSSTPFKSKKKDLFLSNVENYQNFIYLLSVHLEKSGCPVLHADDDADLLIVDTAVATGSASPIVVIGEDTDILVLLCYHDSTSDQNLYFMSDSKTDAERRRIWNIANTRQVLGEEICQLLPFIHALSGCDATSHIYGVEKSVRLKKMMNDVGLRQLASIFIRTATQEEMQCAGEV